MRKLKYRPWSVRAQTWDTIESYYKDNYEGCFLELIRYMHKVGLSKKVFGLASKNRLIISIYNPIDVKIQSLHITCDFNKKKWVFKYFSDSSDEAQFIRIYPESMGIEKFNQFIRIIGW